MTIKMPVAALLFVVAGAGPVLAACSDDLSALDERTAATAKTAIATASSGQGVAAKRNGEAIASRDASVPVDGLPKGPAAGSMEAQATSQAAQAGGSGDRVMQAKATINDARVAKGKGDEAGCLAAVARAKKQLDQ